MARKNITISDPTLAARARASASAGTRSKFAPTIDLAGSAAEESLKMAGQDTPAMETPELFTNSAGEFTQAEINKVKSSNNDIFYNKSKGEFVWRKGDKRVVIGGDNTGVDQKWIDFAQKQFDKALGRAQTTIQRDQAT